MLISQKLCYLCINPFKLFPLSSNKIAKACANYCKFLIVFCYCISLLTTWMSGWVDLKHGDVLLYRAYLPIFQIFLLNYYFLSGGVNLKNCQTDISVSWPRIWILTQIQLLRSTVRVKRSVVIDGRQELILNKTLQSYYMKCIIHGCQKFPGRFYHGEKSEE